MKRKNEKLIELTKKLGDDCEIYKKKILKENKNIKFVYNPLIYAWKSHEKYLDKYGGLGANTVIMGMNPGHGMGNTGIPFGCPERVRDYLDIKNLKIEQPDKLHPKRIIAGLECKKPEISGKRMWTIIEDIYGPPQEAFKHIFILNHLPLWMFNDNGQNITPDKLKKSSTIEIFSVCNKYLVDVINVLEARRLIAVGKYATKMAKLAIREFSNESVLIDEIPHPSPANPLANRENGTIWKKIVTQVLKKI